MTHKIIGFVVLLLSFFVAWMWMEYRSTLNTPVVIDNSVLFEIKRGDSFSSITNKLKHQQISIKPFWFKLIAYQRKVTNSLKAGEYLLTAGLTAPQILTLFTEGKTRQYSITFPEGWSFKQIIQEINKNPYLNSSLDGLKENEILNKLGIKEKSLEGLFFPDTYYFEKNMTDLSLLQRAYNKMQQTLNQAWKKREPDLPLANAYQALTLASIVEKETGVASERSLIAGVFIRRLRKGMLLQTDPTVIYGMGEHYQGNIRLRDLKTPTPYNTYIIKGLPPTPIAMPGKEAIHAVLHPAKGESLYFVSRGDGSHLFSKSLKEHNRAVDVFQRKRK